MPRQLALLLCTTFVLFLLRLERRGSAGVSTALWIPTLWMLAIASKPLGTWFGMTGQAELGSPLDRFVLVCLGVAGMVVLARRRYDWSGALRGQGWLLALLAYMLVSSLWSDITLISVRRWGREAIVPIMALVIMSEANPRQALESLWRRSAYILIPFSLLLIKYYPAFGVDYGRWSGLQMWIGVTVHKNTLGRLCLVSALFLLWAVFRSWRDRGSPAAAGRYRVSADVVVLLITLFLLNGPENAYSATSIGTFALGATSLLGLAWLRKRRLMIPQAVLLGVVVLFIGLGVSAPFLEGSSLATVSSTLGRDETLTGRTVTWGDLIPVVKSRPLLGSGFGSFWTTSRRELYEMSNGHNGYLDVLLELGWLGLAFYFAWLLSCTRRFHRTLAQDYDWGALTICFLLMVVVYNTTESALNSLAEQLTAVVALASVVVPYEPNAVARRSHLGLRVHLPAERAAGTVASQSGPAEDRRLVRLRSGRGGQRRRGVRARGRGQDQGGTEP
jgi:O-antigen ligase